MFKKHFKLEICLYYKSLFLTQECQVPFLFKNSTTQFCLYSFFKLNFFVLNSSLMSPHYLPNLFDSLEFAYKKADKQNLLSIYMRDF